MNYWIKAIVLASLTTNLFAQEYLVRFKTHNEESKKLFLKRHGGTFELVSKEGNLYKWTSNTRNIPTWDASVGYISKNKKILRCQGLLDSWLQKNKKFLADHP